MCQSCFLARGSDRWHLRFGDTVKLKSGGPLMTITEMGRRASKPSIGCTWFDGAKKCEGDFPAEALEAAEKPKPAHQE